MARPLRIEFPGAVYHITSRGNAKQSIYIEDEDFKEFLRVLCKVVTRYHWLVLSYCLMNNHYHLLVETPEGNLSAGMRQLNGIYTQRFNRKYQRVGHLFQGRYKAILIEKESHLLEVSRYIVLNPVRAGIVERAEQWPWSSYRAMAGISEPIECLSVDWLLLEFGGTYSEAQRRYREFVMAGVGEKPLKDKVKNQIVIGREEFIEKIKEMLKAKKEISEIPREQRFVGRPTLKEILEYRSRELLEESIYNAHVQYGYKIKEIADEMGVHYSTVSKIIKKFEKSHFKT